MQQKLWVAEQLLFQQQEFMSLTKEKEHLDGLKNGKLESFRWIYDRHHEKIYAFAAKMVSDQAAEEITSDVFVKLWQKREKLDPSFVISQLLFKITRDFIWNYLKKEKRETAQKRQYLLDSDNNPIIDPDTSLIFKDYLTIAEKAIQQLPERRQEVFNLRYKLGLNNKEIAHKLSISETTVRVHLSKAIQFLRDYLKSHPEVLIWMMPILF